MKQFFILPLFLGLMVACSQPEKSPTEASTKTPLPEGLYTPDWAKDATIYEVNIRQYSPEGTFAGVTRDLDRLEGMGIEILWLMPVHPIGEKNRKGTLGSYYSVKDYKGVNPNYGTMGDFKALVDGAHQKGMKVIIDWVANHSAFDNSWADDHKDYYTLDSTGNLQPVLGTDWWDVADLNYDNPELRAAMIDAMAFWVREQGVDGFRCDVAMEVPTDFWEVATDSLRAINSEIFMLAESEMPEHHDSAFNMSYAWEWLHIMNGVAKGEKTLADIDAYMAKEDTSFQKDAYRMYFITNHDENSWNGTIMDRFGEKKHKAFAAVTYTIDGMPLLYSGQEAGMDKALEFFEKDPIDWKDYKYQDFYTKLLKLHKENPALWNGEAGGSFERLKTSDDEHVYAFVRTNGDHQVVTIANLSDTRTKLTFDAVPNGDFKPLFDQESLENIGQYGLELEPYGFHIFYK